LRCRNFTIAVAAAAVCAGARAGDLGPTSRESVAISITVPPHFTVQAASATTTSGLVPLCIGANAVQGYGIVIYDTEGRQIEPVAATWIPAVAGRGCIGSSGNRPRTKAVELPEPQGALTLLIVPN